MQIVKTIPIEQIDEGKRSREDLGDIKELADDISRHGMIQTIAVLDKKYISDEMKLMEGELDENKPYLLLGGGRRFNALKYNEAEQVNCLVYQRDMEPDEIKIIELHENLYRKSLDFREEIQLKASIHELQVKLKGEKIHKHHDGGQSLTDTANMLGTSKSTISRDLQLAKKMKENPDVAEKAKNKKEAMKLYAKREEEDIKRELAKRRERQQKTESKGMDSRKQKLMKSYVLMNCFDGLKEIPDNTKHLVEIDPPYAIDLKKKKKQGESTTEHYNEIAVPDYKRDMTKVLSESFRILRPGGWLIFWFAPEPWFETVYQWILEAGFECKRMPAIWYKGQVGQTMQPSYNLANSYEMFFYARKERSVIINQGRSNVFDYSPVHHDKKIHPTERPISMMCDILETFTHEGSQIVVPYAGSGVTLEAAHKCNMKAIGFDLSQQYKDSFDHRIHTADSSLFAPRNKDIVREVGQTKTPSIDREIPTGVSDKAMEKLRNMYGDK